MSTLKRAGRGADVRAVTLADRISALPGWHAVAGVPTSIGSVALVAIGPGGGFVVESASALCARHPADVPERPLIHTWALARHLSEVVGRPLTPVLAVDARLDGLGGRRRGVHVVRGELVPNWLAERPPVLDPVGADVLVARLHALLPAAPAGEPTPAAAPAPEKPLATT